MIIKSDWHIHSEHSYDAKNPLSLIAERAKEQGLTSIGITDHLNFNDTKFIGDLKNSASAVKDMQKTHQGNLL
jgi:histidinol phosphatase-like PHP family hydrolase